VKASSDKAGKSALSLREENKLRSRLRALEFALDDLATGGWRRYPESGRHGCTTVEDYAMWVLEHDK